ncbi:MBL fold metallo-hydrolase [Mesobacillus harenae]|uniref:MBL fold metallo-hydrolase n=1 Tax=Mesobacillus harenae TaxID=2213203 RepID=UPI00157FFC4B|nr:MBL fold metallo-hydrolase [Mesobacillus harenae]
MQKPEKLAENLYLIDDYDLKMEERTGTYVLTEQDLTLIETCASPSVPKILKGLNLLGLSPENVKYIIVTHIHLDHAGGAGLLLTHCPQAKVVVHPKGIRHLEDPSRLIAGAKSVYGERFDELFDPILPVASEQLIVKNDRESLTIGPDCTLTFYDSPGHSNHHFSIFHPNTSGMFTGDTAGIRYPQLVREGIELYLPSTSPNQFSPEKMLHSLELFKSLSLKYIYFGHYGMSSNPEEVYKQVEDWLKVFLEEAESAFLEGNEFLEKVFMTTERLQNRVAIYLLEKGIDRNHQAFEILSLDLSVSAMGLIDYLQKRK